MLLYDLIYNKRYSNHIAVVYKENSYSYADLYKDCAKLLMNNKEVTGNIGVFIENSYNYIVAFFAGLSLKRTIVPISPGASIAEIASTMNYCEISLLITDSIHLKKIKALLTDYNSKIQVLLMDESVSYEYGDLTKIIYTQPSDSETSIALLVHTSGSLSKPKRVALSHKNLLSNAHSIIESLAISSEDITLIGNAIAINICNYFSNAYTFTYWCNACNNGFTICSK